MGFNGCALLRVYTYSGSSSPKVAAAKSDLATISSALQNFRLDCDRYPTQKERLKALTQMPVTLESKWKGPYISRLPPTDPWARSYLYQTLKRGKSQTYRLTSFGEDGIPGGIDEAADIVEEGP